MKKWHIIVCVLLIMAATLSTFFWYSELPVSVPIHWDFEGRPDGYGSRAMLYLLGPGLMSVMLVIGLCLPWLSPKRFELDTFKETYSYLIVIITCLFGFLYATVLYAILTGAQDIQRIIYFGIFLSLILMGNPTGKIKRNFYIGVKTPWTLASEKVWYVTHRLCARLMVGSGLLGLLAVFFNASLWIILTLSCGWAFFIILFSLLYYKRLERIGLLDTK